MTKPILGVILAGGEARRMGGADKALLRLGNQSLINHILTRMSPQLDGMAISARGATSRYAAFGVPVIFDERAEAEGPLAGVLAGLAYARQSGFAHILTLPCDTPFLPDDLGRQLLAAKMARKASVVIAAAGREGGSPRLHPGIALCDVTAHDPLQRLFAQGERALRHAYRAIGMDHVLWPAEPFDPFFNINRPEDLAQAEALLAGEPCPDRRNDAKQDHGKAT